MPEDQAPEPVGDSPESSQEGSEPEGDIKSPGILGKRTETGNPGKKPPTDKQKTGKENVPRETSTEKRKYTLQHGESTEEVELTDEEVRVRLQKAKAAEKKFEEAANLRKEAEKETNEVRAMMKRIKEDPISVLTDPRINVNVREVAEKYLAGELEREMMDPKDRELQQLRAAQAAVKAKEEEAEKKRLGDEENDKQTKKINAMKDMFAKKISEVLKDSPLPHSPESVSRIAAYMKYAHANDIDTTVDDIREKVIENYQSEFKSLFGKASPDQIAALLGEDVIKAIRKWDNERVTKGKTPLPNGKDTSKPKDKKKWKTPDQDNLERYGSLYSFYDEY